MLFNNLLVLLSSFALPLLAIPLNGHRQHHRHVAHTKRAERVSRALPLPQSDGEKRVVAHFMVGNTYPYTADDWKEDIIDAHNVGIDGFALNIGPEVWQHEQVAAAYAAAQDLLNSGEVTPAFGFFLSFDMAVLPGSAPQDAVLLRKFITDYYHHPNQMKYDGKSLASTFSGQDSTFGHPTSEQGWAAEFTNPLAGAGMPVHFVPAFFVSPERMAGYDAADGVFIWNSGFVTEPFKPVEGVPDGQPAVSKLLGSLDQDRSFIPTTKSASKTYMAAVAPWFYTHYGADSFDKNWVYYSDHNVYSLRWENLVLNRDDVDIVEIVTWNDFGESSYIGRIKGEQPRSQAWVDGMDHTPWLKMTAYYAKAFKTGQWPEIQDDEVYLVARTHPKDASCDDSVGKPRDYALLDDSLFAVVFASAPSTVILSTSDSRSKTFEVEAGVHRLTVPLTIGGYIRAEIKRGGASVLELQPPEYQFTATPSVYNYNAFVAYGSTASP